MNRLCHYISVNKNPPAVVFSFKNSSGAGLFLHRKLHGPQRDINKILVSNRGEIAVRIFRAAKEMKIKSVAIYTSADAHQNHRFKADEAYLVGKNKDPVSAYLDCDEIINLAKKIGADSIHPGYGFLSERGDFVEMCEQNGIKFIGPSSKVVKLMGDKIACRKLAIECGVPIIPGTETPISELEEAHEFIKKHGFPIIFKAAYGGGGRGMRVVHHVNDVEKAFKSATSESAAAFGNGALFIERYIEKPRHIEVQVLGDEHGNVVHLFERDCSVQRRHQKVIELAPAPNISESLRTKLTDLAVKLCKFAKYQSAGTVEFLVDPKENVYFIEVNSRVQVEHTVSEEITGIDIVKNQLLISSGMSLPDIGLTQDKVKLHGSSIQARVTTEDPQNNFTPDLGRIIFYSAGGGPGIRLDGSCGYSGANISPYYDSLLTKVISKGADFNESRVRLIRCLEEFNVQGVKTNIPFILNVLKHPDFSNKFVTTDFIAKYPELTKANIPKDDSYKLLKFIGTVAVNGPQTPLGTNQKPSRIVPTVPHCDESNVTPKGWRDILVEKGPAEFAKAIVAHPHPLITDTTFRDAHQSLLATRMRTYDLNRISPFVSKNLSNIFSLECWGGATFDVAMRFLLECPWERLAILREQIPNIPFQMLLRGANAVGYKNYPDNVVYDFCRLSKQHGMDIFRIFDALNYVPNIQLAMDAVNKAGGVVEAAISYSGDVSNQKRTKYTLDYYMKVADELIKNGAHILAIKDMSGVLKPRATEILVTTLRKEYPNIPIHIHTHDTAGTGIATYMAGIKAGAQIVDVACDSMSGMTSQPTMGGLVAALSHTEHDLNIELEKVSKYSAYFEQTRLLYAPFESTITMKSGNADVYVNEIPGGQYTNLQFQAFSLGLGDQFEEVKQKYVIANELLGDIIKVTPTSKVVGDLAQFMVQNNLSKEDVLNQASHLNFPNSVIEFFKGELGDPYGGYPEPLRTHALKGKPFVTGRPGSSLSTLNMDEIREKLIQEYGANEITEFDVISYALYPQVFQDYMKAKKSFGPVGKIPTPCFFDACQVGEEVSIQLGPHKHLLIKLLAIGEAKGDGTKDVFFEVNGEPVTLNVVDKSKAEKGDLSLKADSSNKTHIPAPMPGQVIAVKVAVGAKVKKGDVLFVLSAMKMETDVTASFSGTIKEIHVSPKKQIQAGDLLGVIEPDT